MLCSCIIGIASSFSTFLCMSDVQKHVWFQFYNVDSAVIARDTAACAWCPNWFLQLSFLLQCLERGLCTGGITATAIYSLQSFQQ